MKRTALLFLLTSLSLQAPGALEVAEVVPVRGAVPARLCPGDNAVRVTLRRRDTTAALRPAALRLALVIPGGPPAGTLLAEGSATAAAGAATTTFTFLHVEIAERLRGRGARLVVRVDGGGAAEERALPLDEATDWSCRPR
jgi:hypothetical protein